MSEEQASALFVSIDTADSGSITEEQFAESILRGGAGQPHGHWNDQAVADAATTIIA